MKKTSKSPAAESPLVTPQELAAKYQVAKSTILEWFHAGKIPAVVAIGKVYRFDPDCVAKALAKDARNHSKSPAGRVPVV